MHEQLSLGGGQMYDGTSLVAYQIHSKQPKAMGKKIKPACCDGPASAGREHRKRVGWDTSQRTSCTSPIVLEHYKLLQSPTWMALPDLAGPECKRSGCHGHLAKVRKALPSRTSTAATCAYYKTGSQTVQEHVLTAQAT